MMNPTLIVRPGLTANSIARCLLSAGYEIPSVLGNSFEGWGDNSFYIKKIQEKRGLVDYVLESNTRFDLYLTADEDVLSFSLNEELVKSKHNLIIPTNSVCCEQISKVQSYKKILYGSDFKIPKTMFLDDTDKINVRFIKNNFNLPIVLKPFLKKAILIQDWKILDEYFRFRPVVGTVLQEFIEDGRSVFASAFVNEKGEILGLFCGERSLQYPKLVGNTVLAKTVHDSELEYLATKYISQNEIVGPCSIEFLYSKASHQPYFVESTVGRYNLHTLLPAMCGVNLAAMQKSDYIVKTYIKNKYVLPTNDLVWVNESGLFMALRSVNIFSWIARWFKIVIGADIRLNFYRFDGIYTVIDIIKHFWGTKKL